MASSAMRSPAAVALLLLAAVLAAPARAASGSVGCSGAAALPPVLANDITNEITKALQPKSGNTINNSSSKSYISFTVPPICYNGNWFGYNVIPKGCITNGKTYAGSTGKTTSVSGAYNVKVVVNSTQTACTNTGGVLTSSSAINVTANWPSIVVKTTLDWYPLAGGSTGVGITLSVTNLHMLMTGSVTYSYTTSTNTTCITAATIASTTITYGSLSGQFTVAGGNAGALPPKVINRVGAGILNKGSQVTTSVNKQLASNVVGNCQKGSPS